MQNFLQWQSLAIRVYLGLDMIPHFLEKLSFFGWADYEAVVHNFIKMGISYPYQMVILAGLIEFAIFLSFTFGFLTRIGAIVAAVYLFFATLMGQHFLHGFLWVASGGGWEFPIMWGFLYLTFVLTGGGP